MFRAIVIGLGSLSLIALLVVGVRQIDLGSASERIVQFFAGGENLSPILRQADADAQYVRQDHLTSILSDLHSAIGTEERQRGELAAQLRELQAQQARIADVLAGRGAVEAPLPTQPELTTLSQASREQSETLADQKTRLDALQKQVQDKLVVLTVTQNRLNTTVQSLQRGIDDAAPDLGPLETRIRGIELQMQLLANTLASLSGRVDRLVLSTGATPTRSASGAAVDSKLTCAPARVDEVYRSVSAQRLQQMYESCQGLGSRPPRVSSLRNSTKCFQIEQWEACLGVERVYLQQQ